ncbi:hypothetical protein DL93DRAFT_1114698 [Clavulina sp. PMI_390]|nr:hypothetical protein DL93DRAFT_1114698 [Clavulina sp. PMI_390]
MLPSALIALFAVASPLVVAQGTSPIGTACTTDSDCASGKCWPEYWTYGQTICSGSPAGDACSTDGDCVAAAPMVHVLKEVTWQPATVTRTRTALQVFVWLHTWVVEVIGSVSHRIPVTLARLRTRLIASLASVTQQRILARTAVCMEDVIRQPIVQQIYWCSPLSTSDPIGLCYPLSS